MSESSDKMLLWDKCLQRFELTDIPMDQTFS